MRTVNRITLRLASATIPVATSFIDACTPSKARSLPTLFQDVKDIANPEANNPTTPVLTARTDASFVSLLTFLGDIDCNGTIILSTDLATRLCVSEAVHKKLGTSVSTIRPA